ncbi:MAG: hypothetical protein FK734_02940 [Asgard group archaeon]|nr:hypothetical protein [Asgard group archaeon]
MNVKFFDFKSIHKRIEEKLVQLAYIPKKYIEAMYIESSTKIPIHLLDICEEEEKRVRNELLDLMKEGEVDTKIEIEKFQLFERINEVNSKSKQIRSFLIEFDGKLTKDVYDSLVEILKNTSEAGKLMYEVVKTLYDDFDKTFGKINNLYRLCDAIIEGLFDFKFCKDGKCDYRFEDPEVLIGNEIRATLLEMKYVADKVQSIIETFSFKQQDIHAKEQRKLKREERKEKWKNRKEARETKKVQRIEKRMKYKDREYESILKD